MSANLPLITDKIDFEIIESRAAMVIDALHNAEYTTVSFLEIQLATSIAYLVFSALDDFQADAHNDLKVDQYSFQYLIISDFVDVHNFISKLRSREVRELRFATRLLSNLTNQADKLTSLAGQEFAAELKAAANSRWTMLENLEARPNATSDEIPF